MGMFTIVSLCGGGIRGLMSAAILRRLADADKSILSRTDLFAGTSTGSGIISLLLAGKSPQQVVEYFLDQEVGFFKRQRFIDTEPAYSVELVAAGQAALHGDKRLTEFAQKVVLTAFNVGAGATADAPATPWAPRLYSNVVVPDTLDATVVEAVTASSAMPGMMGSYKGNVDGAFVNHDPTLVAVALAVARGHRLEDIAVIDIGTGLMPDWIASDTGRWGAAQWQNGDGNPASRTPPFLINGTSSPILDLCLNGTSADVIPTLARMMLPGRYVYLNPTLPRPVPENATSPEDLELLQRKAEELDIGPAVALLRRAWSSAGA